MLTRQFLKQRRNSAAELLESRVLFAASAVNSFAQVNLVSDGSVSALVVDPSLVNAWGLTSSVVSPNWIAANGSGMAVVHDAVGTLVRSPVTLPAPSSEGAGATSAPTGAIFNSTGQFAITANNVTSPARFLFATEDGTIIGFKGAVDPNNGVIAVDNSANGAVYKGLALGSSGGQNFLYAADFHNARIDVFASSFGATTLAGNFTEPNLPAGYAPFNIVNINGSLYVSYALQDAAKHDDVPGLGNGFIDVYNTDGTFNRRLVSQGALDAPWAMVTAPSGFGRFGGDLLVGNFGNGTIHVYDPNTGTSLGRLRDTNGITVQIDGLWALKFGNGHGAGPSNVLEFTAGPNGETHGLFGSLTFTPPQVIAIPQPAAPATPIPTSTLLSMPVDIFGDMGGSVLM